VTAVGSRRRCLFGCSGLGGLASTLAAEFVLSLHLELPLYRFVCFPERLLVLGNGGIVLGNLRQSAIVRSLVTVSITRLICTVAHVRKLSSYLLMLIAFD
jgi:hypothetical protein